MHNSNDPMTMYRVEHQLIKNYMQQHWQLFLAEGIVFILLGISAIVFFQIYSLAIVIFLGWIMVLAGISQVMRSLYLRMMPSFGSWLCLGVLQVMVGCLLLINPVGGVITITMLMVLFFALEGGVKIYLALMLRPLPHWKFIFFSGLTALIFALIILANWSEFEHWLLGVFLGINMIILGFAMLNMSLAYKNSD